MKTGAKVGLSVVGLVAVVAGSAYLGKPDPRMVMTHTGINANPSTVTLVNESSVNIMAYIAFGADSVVLPSSITACNVDAGLTCQFMVPAHENANLPLGGQYLNATVSYGAPVACGSTKAEVNVN